jgi:hypothetical protein
MTFLPPALIANYIQQSDSTYLDVKAFVAEFIARNGFGPTISEICIGVGIIQKREPLSKSVVWNALKKLARDGILSLPGKDGEARVAGRMILLNEKTT